MGHGVSVALKLIKNPKFCYTIDDFIEVDITKDNDMNDVFIASDS